MADFDPQDPTTWPDHLMIGISLAVAAVCTRGTDAQAAAFANAESPTGISSNWTPDDKVRIPWHDNEDPEPGHRACPDDPENRRHVGLSC